MRVSFFSMTVVMSRFSAFFMPALVFSKLALFVMSRMSSTYTFSRVLLFRVILRFMWAST